MEAAFPARPVAKDCALRPLDGADGPLIAHEGAKASSVMETIGA
jgi:hypothetical protein